MKGSLVTSGTLMKHFWKEGGGSSVWYFRLGFLVEVTDVEEFSALKEVISGTDEGFCLRLLSITI